MVQILISAKMNRQNMVYSYNEVLFNFKMKCNSNTYNNDNINLKDITK